MRWIQGKPAGKPLGGVAVAGACFKNATMAIQVIAATASHSDTDKYRQRHNLHGSGAASLCRNVDTMENPRNTMETFCYTDLIL
ncbi:hypothetical protein CBM2614_A250114 [Cupriavidus taiwanensis]|nr:hypothetical protein CBM2614_A250114 [Cupriavidus taiwanensis]